MHLPSSKDIPTRHSLTNSHAKTRATMQQRVDFNTTFFPFTFSPLTCQLFDCSHRMPNCPSSSACPPLLLLNTSLTFTTGIRLRTIQDSTGCRCWVGQSVSDSQPRRVCFQGPPDAVRAATLKVQELMSKTPVLSGRYGSIASLTSVTLLVPKEMVGRVFGAKVSLSESS